MSKKGLAIIYNPHNLYEFVWYYCNSGKIKEWDALCLPSGYKGEYMHSFCEATGIFQNVYSSDTDFSALSGSKKIKQFAAMFGYALIGRKKSYCKKLLNRYVKADDYDEFAVISCVGMVAGACMALGRENKVVMFEDGINDYGNRPNFIPLTKLKSSYDWQGLIMSKLGYCSPGWYKIRTDKNCIKYSSRPDKMTYRNYKEIRQLFSKEGTDNELFDIIVKKMYPLLRTIDFENADVVLMTRPIDDFVKDDNKYIARLEKYISDNYKNVLVKKHPRETTKYEFPEGIKSFEIDNSIPAEAMLRYLAGKDIIIVTTSAIMLYLKAYGLSSKMIMFNELYEESDGSSSKYRPLSGEEAAKFCDTFAEGCYEIIWL